MKKIFIMAGIALMLSACSSKEVRNTENTEETVAEIEAAQMEGRNAAKGFATKVWSDTLQLQRQLMEVRAEQSKYVLSHKPKCAAAYDSTFVSTIRTVRPDLAPHLSVSKRK